MIYNENNTLIKAQMTRIFSLTFSHRFCDQTKSVHLSYVQKSSLTSGILNWEGCSLIQGINTNFL